MSEIANETTALDFVADFLKLYETRGIEDKFDKQTNKMETSNELYALVQEARRLMPEKMKTGLEADKANQALQPVAIEEAITAAPRVLDARKVFARRMSVNKGAQGLAMKLLEAQEAGNIDETNRIIEEMKVLGQAIRDNDDDLFNSAQ